MQSFAFFVSRAGVREWRGWRSRSPPCPGSRRTEDVSSDGGGPPKRGRSRVVAALRETSRWGCDGGHLGTSAPALSWFSDTRCWLSSVLSGSCMRKPAEAGLKANGSTSLAQQVTKLRASSMPKVFGGSSGSWARLVMRWRLLNAKAQPLARGIPELQIVNTMGKCCGEIGLDVCSLLKLFPR